MENTTVSTIREFIAYATDDSSDAWKADCTGKAGDFRGYYDADFYFNVSAELTGIPADELREMPWREYIDLKCSYTALQQAEAAERVVDRQLASLRGSIERAKAHAAAVAK